MTLDQGSRAARLLAAATLTVGGCLLASSHASWPVIQVALVAGCFIVGLLRPHWFAAIFPLAWVIGDAYPLTGQILVKEYDSILLATAGGVLFSTFRHAATAPHSVSPHPPQALARGGESDGRSRGRKWNQALPWWLLGAATVLSLLIGWQALPAGDWDDPLSIYFTRWNAVREAKGYFLGALFASLAWHHRHRHGESRVLHDGFAVGVQVASAYVIAAMMAERWMFKSLWQFETVYRATGPFFTMHIGDHHVDAFLVMAFPYAWYGWKGECLKWRFVVRLLLSMGLTYCVIATMSRATIVVLGLEICVLASWATLRILPWQPLRYPYLSPIAGLAASCVAVVLMYAVAQIAPLKNRFETAASDIVTRTDHWEVSADREGQTFTTATCGHGAGTFPTYMAGQRGVSFPPLQRIGDKQQNIIRLQPGWPIYLEQWLTRGGDEGVVVSGVAELVAKDSDDRARARSQLTAIRSRKSLLYSFESHQVAIDVVGTAPQPFELVLPPPSKQDVGEPWTARLRPQSAALFLSGNSAVDISGLTVHVQNKDTPHALKASGLPWSFTCDDHLIWRAKNGLLHIFFSAGILGTIALLWIWLSAFFPPGSSRGQPQMNGLRSLAPCLALGGFIALSMIGTLIDTPWLTGWMLSLVWLASTRS
ncbi:hypothetical protein [Roseimaritima ulvae]|uniref:O-Antigen ligase n=1 Tax=Roseimaritima ulvae TaxID=980254 RepID=A0A5B9QWY1_9BACT|nr:hypothetical protein [Roseimaritima ulvae]QEG42512.1 hypothetical protein UC8_45510 [Roseimaritima ulvae]